MIPTHYKVFDVSMPIFNGMPVYKDKPAKQPNISVVQDFDTATARESRLDMDVHCGTHIDSPLHMVPGGGTMEVIPVETLVGPCRVLDMTHVEGGISRADLETQNIQQGEFLLLKTKNSAESVFNLEFVYLAVDGAEYLVERGIRGVGIDALGIERAQTGHPTHKTLFQSNIVIMEGLRLADVQAGDYFLCGAPIKVLETEAAPARVLLLQFS
ncbi:cyclase family protein [Tumebacillus flagellatus]|uniref:Kynurenine formamidase n=1 Tax=Tumebacillus flagellatus TaxID=1157490 RepID=A0A074LR88_9BACL|nr:cyclase family protein [Tumebacillus flagellatus]KEO83015.1 cyclase [Tumebacillus flagellatus]